MKFEKRSIWRANPDPVIGSEQGKSRPVLIISEDDVNDILNIVNVIPLTSRKPDKTIYPNEVLILAEAHGLEKESIALCHQIRTIDKRRLSRKYRKILTKTVQQQIIEAICFQLGINKSN